MRNGILYLFLLWFSSLAAQEFALKDLAISSHRMEWIKIESEESSVRSFIVYPDSLTVAPAMIIIHDEFGMTEWIKSFANQVASENYVAFVPDLVTGESTVKVESRGLRNWGDTRDKLLNMDQEQLFASIDMVFKFTEDLSSCNGTILIAGLGWGGSQVFRYLSHNNTPGAGLVFYGRAPVNKKKLKPISTPIYGFYGEYDSRVNKNLWRADKKMKQLGKPFYPVIFDFGGHGFMRSGERPNANEGNVKARTAAWIRLQAILKEYNENNQP
jgi:carboxymethylenebutenolidase